jgi:hypothetical protein
MLTPEGGGRMVLGQHTVVRGYRFQYFIRRQAKINEVASQAAQFDRKDNLQASAEGG